MLHQCERVPQQYELANAGQNGKALPSVTLRSHDDNVAGTYDFHFEALRPNLFRTTFTSSAHPLPPYPSARRPTPDFGKDPLPDVTTDPEHKTRIIQTSAARAVVRWTKAPIVSLYLPGAQKPIHEDLHFRSYAVDDTGVAHYSSYKKDGLYVGLGEKAAPMNLAGRGFILSASDTFGYDAYRTDPLYKHIPLLINVTPAGCLGVFSTSHSRGHWSIGSEIDGMWGHYKVYRQAHGGLEQYLIVGRTVEDVVRSYAELVGFPLLVPRYMMGYISGGMKYSMEDEPRACDAILGFLDNCAKHDIPVSAFQMSSGYTVAETEPKTRNVMTWNKHRFPDAESFTKECHRRGVRLLANVKPYVLENHPEYAKLSAAGAFFKDPVTGKTALARLWSAGGGESGEGSHIDFTSTAGFDWWYEGCKALKAVGIDAMWNDNNEYNIPSDDWQCALENVEVPEGEGRKHVGLWGRAMHTELMAKSSHDACVDAEPDARPLVLTRSATAGTMRYASCSWSGDNVTSWEGMKGGNALAINAGFSLLQTYGHDIGGFEGPQPTPEHLVRWIQLGIHSPRFAINCFKTSPDDNLIGEVIEPWMYPSATPIIRTAIKRRYELIPYTYSLHLKSHRTAVPPQRWTGWGFEMDPEVWTKQILAGDTQYWFGDSLLVAGVYEPGETKGRVYLPRNGGDDDPGYLNTNAPYQFLEAGCWHDISSTWHTSIPIIARCGGVLPIGKDRPTVCRGPQDRTQDSLGHVERDDWRGIEIYPPPVRPLAIESTTNGTTNGPLQREQPQMRSQVFEYTWLEDDGISSSEGSEGCAVKVWYGAKIGEGLEVRIQVVREATWEPLWLGNGVDVFLPVGEERLVCGAIDKGRDTHGRRIWQVEATLAPTH